MHDIYTNYGKYLPGDDLVPSVTEVEYDTRRNHLRHCKPHVMFEVAVEVFIVVTEVTPPGIVMWVSETW